MKIIKLSDNPQCYSESSIKREGSYDMVYFSDWPKKFPTDAKMIKFPFNIERLIAWLVKQISTHYWLFWLVYKMGIRIKANNRSIQITINASKEQVLP